MNKYAKVDLQDNEGRRPNFEPPRVISTDTLGVGGTAIFGGFVQELEKDSTLAGRRKYQTYSELLANIAIVATGIRFFLNLVSKADWKIEPPKDSGEKGQEMADLVKDILHDMETPWHRVTRRGAMFKYYGFSVAEWTAKIREDGVIGLLDIEPRAQVTIEQWDTDKNSRVLGAVQRSPQTQRDIYLPREKIVYLVDDSISDSPEGLGLFRHLVDPGKRLRRYLQLEGFGFENDLRGIPVARAPLTDLDQMVKNGAITKAKADELLAGMEKFLTNHIKSPSLAVMMDSKTYVTTDQSRTPSQIPQWDLKILDGGTYSLKEINDAIRRTVLDIARIMGVEHLIMGDGDKGSFALAKEKARNFGLIVDNTLKELAEQYEKDILGPLWELNGWDKKLKPKLKTESISHRDLDSMAAVLMNLSTAGVVLDRNDEAVQEIFDLLGLSRLEELELMDPRAQLIAPGQPEAEEMPPGPEERANRAGDGA